MQRVIGIGGIVLKSSNPRRLRDGFQNPLGVDVQSWVGALFDPAAAAKAGLSASIQWSVFKQSNDCFDPSSAPSW